MSVDGVLELSYQVVRLAHAHVARHKNVHLGKPAKPCPPGAQAVIAEHRFVLVQHVQDDLFLMVG